MFLGYVQNKNNYGHRTRRDIVVYAIYITQEEYKTRSNMTLCVKEELQNNFLYASSIDLICSYQLNSANLLII